LKADVLYQYATDVAMWQMDRIEDIFSDRGMTKCLCRFFVYKAFISGQSHKYRINL